ncbi:MAG: hypothetical protein HQ527_11055 [Cyanobacteria bacterium]|nr:hypothetical protein [Cyanobacteria bacterium bin.51]
MSTAPSDGCASGCGGCLLILLVAGLFVAGPTGWLVAVVVLVILWLAERSGKSRRRPQPRAMVAEPMPPLPPPESQIQLEPGTSDRELETLLAEARKAVDDWP